MKRFSMLLIMILLIVPVMGQSNTDKVRYYFNLRSCLPGIAATYNHDANDNEGWGGFYDTIPNVVGVLDSEGIEKMCDYAGRNMAARVEEFAFGNVFYRAYQPVINNTNNLNHLIYTMAPGADKKVLVVSRPLMDTMKRNIIFLMDDSLPLDHNYAGKPMYFGYLWSRIGVFSSLGLSTSGMEYNAVSMNIGAIEFELNVKSAVFSGNQLEVDYECWVKPAGTGITYYKVQ